MGNFTIFNNTIRNELYLNINRKYENQLIELIGKKIESELLSKGDIKFKSKYSRRRNTNHRIMEFISILNQIHEIYTPIVCNSLKNKEFMYAEKLNYMKNLSKKILYAECKCSKIKKTKRELRDNVKNTTKNTQINLRSHFITVQNRAQNRRKRNVHHDQHDVRISSKNNKQREKIHFLEDTNNFGVGLIEYIKKHKTHKKIDLANNVETSTESKILLRKKSYIHQMTSMVTTTQRPHKNAKCKHSIKLPLKLKVDKEGRFTLTLDQRCIVNNSKISINRY